MLKDEKMEKFMKWEHSPFKVLGLTIISEVDAYIFKSHCTYPVNQPNIGSILHFNTN